MGRIEKDRKTLYFMIDFYCQKKHKVKNNLCEDCDELYNYASKKLDLCKFGENKPSCKNCTIHCYKPDMRDRIRDVMRFSGPRVIFHRPHQYIRYVSKSSGKQAEPSK